MTDALSDSPLPGIARLLQDNRFVVPTHQRDYSWTEDDVKQLFDDIEDSINKTDSYFLGLLVFLTGKNQLTILDGQQRLATIVIIFSAIRDWLNQYSDQKVHAEKIQDRFIGQTELGETNPKPQLIMNLANNKLFGDYVIKSASIDDIEQKCKTLKKNDPNRLLLQSIIYSHKRVKEIAQKYSDAQDAAKYFFKFVNYLRDNTRTVQLIVANESAAYTIFETLNDRGVDLSPLDLVKNFLFAKAAADSVDSLRDIQARWVQMMATLSNVKSSSFLKTFWTSRYGRIRSTLIFEKFRTEYSDTQRSLDLSVELLSAAEQYSALDFPDDPIWAAFTKDAMATVGYLKILGNQQVHPVMLSALAKLDISETQKLLRILEVVIVRFLLIGGGNPGRLEPTCAKLAKMIFSGEVTTASGAFDQLKEVYPSDGDFEAAFRAKTERTSQKARYFLTALEKQAQVLANGKMANEWVPSELLTLEHILPKKPGAEWKAVTDADPELLDDCLNRLGNMCLLTDVNKELGQKSFGKKKITYAASQLITTKKLSEIPNDGWNRDAIDNRQADMAQLAKVVWRLQK